MIRQISQPGSTGIELFKNCSVSDGSTETGGDSVTLVQLLATLSSPQLDQ